MVHLNLWVTVEPVFNWFHHHVEEWGQRPHHSLRVITSLIPQAQDVLMVVRSAVQVHVTVTVNEIGNEPLRK